MTIQIQQNKRNIRFLQTRTGQVVSVINIPAEAVASLTWGGPNLDILFVGTWSKLLDPLTGGMLERPLSADSGKIFAVTGFDASVSGAPTYAACF